MVQSVHFAVHAYRRDRSGRLIQSKWTPCETADEAIARAERSVLIGRTTGAAAVSQRCSGEFEEGEAPITLADFGEVPADVKLMVPF